MTNTELDSTALAAIKANAAAVPDEDLAKEIAFAHASAPSPSANFPEAIAWTRALMDEQWRRAGVDLDDLNSDGDTEEMNDGRKLRLRIEHDDTNPFNEYETYGKVEAAGYDRYSGRETRPDGFDGNAEKLNGAWWQPPSDGPKRGTEEFRKFRSLVRDLIEYGMHYVALEVLQGEDAYHRPIAVQVASLGGIDSLDDGYLAEVVRELADELDLF